MDAHETILLDWRPDMDIQADAQQAISTLSTANSNGVQLEVAVFRGQVTLTGHMRSEMIAPCAGYPFDPTAFSANAGLRGSPTVIVVQPVQHRECHHLPCLSLSGR